MSCVVCDEIAGSIPTPGGLLHDEAPSVGFHAPPAPGNALPYLGHLMVTPRRHIASWSGLDDGEAASLSAGIRDLTRLLEMAGAERVYAAVIGTHVAHLHVHLLPRWPGTPREVPWHAVDEWEGARHGDADDVQSAVDRLRQGQPPVPAP
ncbi:MAG TPA: HIT family protein [Trebonia sp.]|jgi:diadenosine tetraphosphate (Ap4A) HIT family hydrolase|nr:HIT family protein [Trebonia sp.]